MMTTNLKAAAAVFFFGAAVWLNRYSKYWQNQFDTLAGWLEEIERNKRIHASGKRATNPRKRKEKQP
jgi:hypothetical protein